jgi:hypothetical protein
MATTVEITAEERNELWDLGEMAYSGAFEQISRAGSNGGIDRDVVVEAGQWIGALGILGVSRESDEGCAIALSLPFIYVIDAAKKQALEVLRDGSATLARTLERITAQEIADQFMPPAEGDTKGSYLVALRHIKAVRERMEAAEPGLRRGGS